MTDKQFTHGSMLANIFTGGYDWSEFRAWQHDGRFWWASASGCSCNDFDDLVEDEDVQPVNNLHELFAKASEFVHDGYNDANMDDYARFVIEVQQKLTT